MTGEAILFGVCLTGLQGLQGPLGWEPAAEVTVARDASSCLPRDGADVNAAANIVARTSGGSRIFEWGECQRHKDRGAAGAEGVWGLPLPIIFF